MANSFGGSIKLTGESEYRKALRAINSDLRLYQAEMKAVASSTDTSTAAQKAKKEQLDRLSKSLSEQKEEVERLSKAYQRSVKETGATSEASKSLQTQLFNATTRVNKMESELDKAKKGLKDTGDGFDDAGKKASIFGDVLKANLASEAVIGGLKLLANGVKQVAGAFTGLVKESVKSYAEFEQLKGGVETLFGAGGASIDEYAKSVGKSVDEVKGKYNELMSGQDTVMKNARGAFKTAGMSANQYMETVTSFSATLLQGLGGDTVKAAAYADKAVVAMSDNANKMGTSIESIQYAYQGFAKQNYTMLDNLKLGYGGTASEMARLINDSGVMGESFKATAENVKNIPFDKLIDAIQVTQDKMGITGTTAKEASQTISGSFNSTQAAWENLATSFAEGSDETIKNALNGLIESGTNLVTNVMNILPAVLEGIATMVAEVANKLPELLNKFLPVVLDLVQKLLDALIGLVPQLIPLAVNLINTLATALIQNLPAIINAGIEIIIGLVKGIADSIPKLIPMMIEAIKTIVDNLLKNLPKIIETGIQLLVALIEGLADALPQLIAMLPKIITTVVEVLTRPDMIAKLIKASFTVMIALARGLINSIGEVVKAVPQIIGAFVNGIGGAIGGIVQAGGDMVKGLWNGISNATGWILGKIKDFGQSVLNGIKSFFGIKSPSRLFRDEVGKNLAEGIGVGFEQNMDDVTKQMQNALPTKFDTDVELSTSAGLNSLTAEAGSLAGNIGSFDTMVMAFQEAMKNVKIELDDRKLGDFVVGKVEGAIY